MPKVFFSRCKSAVILMVLSLQIFCGRGNVPDSTFRGTDGNLKDSSARECPPRDRQILSADIICPNKKRALDSLTVLLESDSISIAGIEDYSDGLSSIRIELSEEIFRRVFNGTVSYKIIEYSSRPGSHCQRYIQQYELPLRYKNHIKSIRIPDPQMN